MPAAVGRRVRECEREVAPPSGRVAGNASRSARRGVSSDSASAFAEDGARARRLQTERRLGPASGEIPRGYGRRASGGVRGFPRQSGARVRRPPGNAPTPRDAPPSPARRRHRLTAAAAARLRPPWRRNLRARAARASPATRRRPRRAKSTARARRRRNNTPSASVSQPRAGVSLHPSEIPLFVARRRRRRSS